MKRHTLALVLLLALPALASTPQIQDVQKNAVWNCTGTGSSVVCTVMLPGATHGGNLLAVWAFWESTSAYSASVTDSPTVNANIFLTAVGPTAQSAASTPTTSQIFYARNITASSGADVITVTFSGPATGTPAISGGVVAVEYSGLDTGNPLDDVSGGWPTHSSSKSKSHIE